MSSPSRPLSPKRDSIFNSRPSSPLKNKALTPKSHGSALKKVPKLEFGSSPRPQQASPGFHIYEDSAEEHTLYHKSASGQSASVHDDKENILQPKIMALNQTQYTHRRPLARLDIAQYPGYMFAAGQLQKQPVQLDSLYQPANYNNEPRTLHKFNALPSFVTPPRNSLNKIFHRSSAEVDEVELQLIAKSKEMRRRKRAMSVGVNHGKAHLVSKNGFKICTN